MNVRGTEMSFSKHQLEKRNIHLPHIDAVELGKLRVAERFGDERVVLDAHLLHSKHDGGRKPRAEREDPHTRHHHLGRRATKLSFLHSNQCSAEKDKNVVLCDSQ